MGYRIRCPFCFEKFSVDLFPEEGENQSLVYDCEVCCHPIDIQANWDPDRDRFVLSVDRSSGFG